MLLAIDVGNTNIVYGFFENPSTSSCILHHFRVESGRSRTGDEYAVVLMQLLHMSRIKAQDIKAAIIASVVPSITEPMIKLVKQNFAIDAMVVGPHLVTGMPILLENPAEVGADRIVNAVAAYEKSRRLRDGGGDEAKNGVIVVDFGTATTFDCVSPEGAYLGGAIAPGIHISADALFTKAARLPRIEILKPEKVLGRNTVLSMQSGIVYGYVGLVDGLIERLLSELGFPCRIYATGGLASLIAPLTRYVEEVDDVLTLEGLRILYGRNHQVTLSDSNELTSVASFR